MSASKVIGFPGRGGHVRDAGERVGGWVCGWGIQMTWTHLLCAERCASRAVFYLGPV